MKLTSTQRFAFFDAALIAVNCGLLAGAVDTILALGDAGAVWETPSPVIRSAATTVLFVTVFLFLAFIVIGEPVVRVFRTHRGRTINGLAAFAILTFALLSVFDLMPFGEPASIDVQEVSLLAMAGLGAVFAYGRIEPDRAWALWSAVALCAALATAIAWTAQYPARVAFPQSIAVVAFALLFGTLGRRLRRLGRITWISLASALCILFGVGSIWVRVDIRSYFGPESRYIGIKDTQNTPAVLFITIDTLRRDALSVYNSSTNRTKNLDRLARDSVVFDRAYSPASWTLQAVSSLMTGVDARVHGLSKFRTNLDPSFRTVAEDFAERGFVTAAAVENPWLRPASGLARGFQQYAHFPARTTSSFGDRFENALFPTETTTLLTWLTLNWLEEHVDDPFFYWVHYFDPHDPYTPPPAFKPTTDASAGVPIFGTYAMLGHFMGQWENGKKLSFSDEEILAGRRLYLGEVQYIDNEIGILLDFLQENGIYDDTLIVLTSDHGEEFMEHGALLHGHSVYEELATVPLMIKFPHSQWKGRVADPVSTTSIPATLLQFEGVDRESDCMIARSLDEYRNKSSDDQTERTRTAPIVLFSDYYGPTTDAFIEGGLKFITREKGSKTVTFDLVRDPREQTPEESQKYSEIGQALFKFHASSVTGMRKCYGLVEEAPAEPLDDRTLERLKSLGYL